jgi:hypothetical protein
MALPFETRLLRYKILIDYSGHVDNEEGMLESSNSYNKFIETMITEYPSVMRIYSIVIDEVKVYSIFIEFEKRMMVKILTEILARCGFDESDIVIKKVSGLVKRLKAYYILRGLSQQEYPYIWTRDDIDKNEEILDSLC